MYDTFECEYNLISIIAKIFSHFKMPLFLLEWLPLSLGLALLNFCKENFKISHY
jgi:hypothetical protein